MLKECNTPKFPLNYGILVLRPTSQCCRMYSYTLNNVIINLGE